MKIICNDLNEFAQLVLDCAEAECSKCSLEMFCRLAANEFSVGTLPKGLTSMREIKEGVVSG